MSMKETYTGFAMNIYEAPMISVTEIEIEGVLCQSGLLGNEGYGDGGTTDF